MHRAVKLPEHANDGKCGQILHDAAAVCITACCLLTLSPPAMFCDDICRVLITVSGYSAVVTHCGMQETWKLTWAVACRACLQLMGPDISGRMQEGLCGNDGCMSEAWSASING